jgi:hypothetical protein
MAAERFPIEAGHIMAFARAIGDFNPVYHDEAAARSSEVGGIVAPPTFVQASAQYDPDYPLRPRPGVTWFGSGRTPSGLTEQAPPAGGSASGSSAAGGGGGTGLHAEQHYEYHRPLRAGEVLVPTSRPGETWEKQGRRGGLLRFAESVTEYRTESGELVVTARSVGVRTEQTVSG